MLKSMTGYGRCEELISGKNVLVEIKSVNQRFTDYNIKVPRRMGYLEDKLRNLTAKRIARGKVDIFVSVENFEDTDVEVHLDEAAARNYINALYELRDKFKLRDDISVSLAAGFTDIFRTQRPEENQDEMWEIVKSVAEKALDGFTAMRSREGERIEKDLTARIEYMKTLAKKIDERSPQTVHEYALKLHAKVEELLGDKNIDEARLLTEVAIFADKIAVNEETVRLASHFDEFYDILNAAEPAGRKLDFLIQEINREVNTIGSKAQDMEIAKLVVDLKAEIEKLREQVQNIE